MTATASLDTRLTAHSASALGVFRILTGLMFTMHGTVKLFGWPTGSPAAMAAWPMWWAGVLEVILGVLVAIGWYARAAAFVGVTNLMDRPLAAACVDDVEKHCFLLLG